MHTYMYTNQTAASKFVVTIVLAAPGPYQEYNSMRNNAASVAKHPSPDDVRLYTVTTVGIGMQEYVELSDDVTVDDAKIQDGASLFLLAYSWTNKKTVSATHNINVTQVGIVPIVRQCTLLRWWSTTKCANPLFPTRQENRRNGHGVSS